MRNVVGEKNRYGQILSSDFSKLMEVAQIDFPPWPVNNPVGAAEGCDLLILILCGHDAAKDQKIKDQKIAAFGSSYAGLFTI